jgi:hypothetical protein
VTSAVIKTSISEPSLWGDEDLFRKSFDRTPFLLEHRWSAHSLFEMPRLFQLAQLVKRNSNNVVYDAGEIRVEDRWNQRPEKKHTLEEAIERIDCAGAWVILKHTELDRDYKAMMHEIMKDITRLSGLDLLKAAKNLEAQIMLTSPGRITPYHIDNECNVLLQIKGEKDIFIFDQTDREVLTEKELERFWIGDWNAGDYKVRYQDRAHSFHLAPCTAVHIPVNAPHWVKNGVNVSVSLSINFEWRDELVPDVHRANFFLRSLGITPRPPGQSRFIDSVKRAVIAGGFVPVRSLARGTVRLARRVRGAA